jgi:uncharacterized protein YjiK
LIKRSTIIIVVVLALATVYGYDRFLSGHISTTSLWNLKFHHLGLKDLSGIYFDWQSGNFLILSHESRCIVETTLDGKKIAVLSLVAPSAGLTKTAVQPEGITMDHLGNLYVCDERSSLYVFTHQSATTRPLISEYSLKGSPIAVTDFIETSGLTYNHNSKTLFAVRNKPQSIMELSTGGKLIRKIELPGFDDLEGVAYLGSNEYCAVEEGRGRIVCFRIRPETTEVPYSVAKKFPIAYRWSKGLEGICYDKKSSTLFCVKEKHPQKIYMLKNPLRQLLSP